MRAADCFV